MARKTLTFKDLSRTGITKAEVLRRANAFRDDFPVQVTLQYAIDATIDAAIEHAQGTAFRT